MRIVGASKRQIPASFWTSAGLLAGVMILGGCAVGPAYHTPQVTAPPAFKELTPEDFKNTEGWKVAAPSEGALHGNWWEIFKDPELNALEEQANVSDQSIIAAMNSFFEARALVKEAHAQYYPTVGVTGSITNTRVPVETPTAITEYELPFDASWQPDFWHRIRNTVNMNLYNAQASAADLENTRLTVHAEVAVDYFELRGQDEMKQLLDSTVVAYRKSLELNQVLYQTGIENDESVAQAETQLETTEAADTNLGILRAQYEHAIAVLVGQSASSFEIPVRELESRPPAIPFGVPSQLLERRPDVAATERLVAAANAQIGLSKSAFYPTLTLAAAAGLESLSPSTWFSWPARYWAVGPSIAETIFDAGMRRAAVQHDEAAYNGAVANYRQTVLTAFQQVEDNLAALRILSQQIGQQDAAVKSSQRYLEIANNRYSLGLDPYLDVIEAQTTLLSNQQTAVSLRIQQMTDSVQLVEALGGGWDTSSLPTMTQVVRK